MDLTISRRRLIAASGAVVVPALLHGFEHESTHAVSEGPAYKAGAPMRSEIIDPGSPGSRFLLRGRVLSATTEKAIPQALVDLWNVQNNTEYDFKGFNLRGRQLTAKAGEFQFLTIEAIPYGGRTAHFHFKVSAPGFQPLTTELYLPGITANAKDSSFRNSNILRTSDTAGIRNGVYDFYLRPA